MFKSIAIKHSCRSATSLKNKISVLEKKFDATDIPNSIDNETRKKEIKEELDKLNEKKIQGQIIRSCIQCCEYDEKSSNIFRERAEMNYNRKAIVKLHIDNGYIT